MNDKRKAMEPISKIRTYLKYGFVITDHEYQYCPRCNHVLNAGHNYQPKYFDHCGQKLDLSRLKWKEDKEIGFAERSDMNEPIKNRVV